MKHGSLINAIYSKTASKVPEVGDGITEVLWTDRHAGTIVEVSKSGKSIKYQTDKAIRTDGGGMSDMQVYRYEPQKDAPKTTARLAKNGAWYTVGGMRTGQLVLIGIRDEHYDYSF